MSLLLTAVITLLVFAGGWFIAWGGRTKADWPPGKVTRVKWITVAAALLAGGYTYFTDSRMREITLFEKEGPVSEIAGRDWTFHVVHPGVEHALMVSARRRDWKGTAFRMDVAVQVLTADGGPVLSERQTLERGSFGNTPAGFTRRFTPAEAGPFIVRIQGREAEGVRLLLRIEDPEHTQGVRAKGY